MNKSYGLVWRGMLLLLEIFVQRMMKCVGKKMIECSDSEALELTWCPWELSSVKGAEFHWDIENHGNFQHCGIEFCTNKLRFQEI